jgi:hypothetical protein
LVTNLFWALWSSEKYTMNETLLAGWILIMTKWAVKQVSTITRSWNIEFGIFLHLCAFLTGFCHFWALPVIWEVYYVWNTNRKVDIGVKMRDLTSFCDHLSMKYIIRDIFALMCLFDRFLPFLGTSGHLRSMQCMKH